MYKKMRDYSHEEFVEIIKNSSEDEILNLSANYGGYPVLFRMALDERVSHIPFIQTGSSVIVRNENGEILLEKRSDNGEWCLPGGCQELGEDLRDTAVRELLEETGIEVSPNELILVDAVSGRGRRRVYPNGDICYNNSNLYLVPVDTKDLALKNNPESLELKFFALNDLPEPLFDNDLIEAYSNWL